MAALKTAVFLLALLTVQVSTMAYPAGLNFPGKNAIIRMDTILSASERDSAKSNLSLTIESLSPEIPESDNAFRDLMTLKSKYVQNGTKNSVAHDKHRNCLFSNNLTIDNFLHDLKKSLEKNKLQYPYSSFFCRTKTPSIDLLRLAMKIDQIMNCTHSLDQKRKLQFLLSRLTTLMLSAAVKTFDYVAAFAAARILLNDILETATQIHLSAEQLTSAIGILNSIDLRRSLFKSFSGDLILFRYYITNTLGNEQSPDVMKSASRSFKYLIDRAVSTQKTFSDTLSEVD